MCIVTHCKTSFSHSLLLMEKGTTHIANTGPPPEQILLKWSLAQQENPHGTALWWGWCRVWTWRSAVAGVLNNIPPTKISSYYIKWCFILGTTARPTWYCIVVVVVVVIVRVVSKCVPGIVLLLSKKFYTVL